MCYVNIKNEIHATCPNMCTFHEMFVFHQRFYDPFTFDHVISRGVQCIKMYDVETRKLKMFSSYQTRNI